MSRSGLGLRLRLEEEGVGAVEGAGLAFDGGDEVGGVGREGGEGVRAGGVLG